MVASAVRSAAFLLLLSGLAPLPAAAAMDADAAGRALADAASVVPGASFKYAGASAAGDAITLTGVTATYRDGTAVTVPAVVITGAEPRDTGGFTAARIAFDGGTATDPRGTVSWAAGAIDDVVVPSKDEIATRDKVRPFASLAMTGVSVASDKLSAPLAVDTVDLTVDDIVEGLPSGVAFHAGGLRISASLLGGSIAGVMAQMMGYEEFVADVAVDGVYDTAAHTAVLNALGVDIQTVGKLTVAAAASEFSIGGMTDPNEDVSKDARAKARLDTLSVRFDNAGVVERFLDMQAQMLGATRDDVRKQLVEGALPFALSFVKNVPFREAFLAEASKFLQDPRSFTVTAQPAEPLPLGQVVRALTRAPTTVPDLLAPRVEANN